MRWKRSIVLAAALMLPLAACQTEGEEAGSEEAEIEVEAPDVPEPDVIVEDQEPDVIVDEEDEGFEADVNVDEEGNVSGGVKVNEREP